MLTPEEIAKIRAEAGVAPIEEVTKAPTTSLSVRLGLESPQEEVKSPSALSRIRENITLPKATKAVTSVFPGKQIGEAVGGGIAALGRVAQGDTEGAKEILRGQPTPGKLAGDVGKTGALLGSLAVAPAASIPGKAAQFGALGALSGASESLEEGGGLKETVRKAADKAATGAITGTALGIAGKGFKALGDKLGSMGEKIQTSVIKPSQADIKDGFSIKTVNKYNLGGSLKQTFEKTDTTLDDLSKKLNEKLAGSNSSVDLNKVYEKTAKRLFGNKLESFGSNTQMEGAVEKLRNEIVAVSGENGLVSVPESQLVKRAAGHFGAWTFGVPTPEATANQKVYNTFYNELKKAIEEASPEGVREINKQISELIPVMNALIRRIPVAERNASLSLTDVISLTGAALEPRALGLTLLNMASKSGRVGAALAKKAPALGESLAGVTKSSEPVVRTLMNK